MLEASGARGISLTGLALGIPCSSHACSDARCGLCAQVFELFYDFLVDSEAQQGASQYTLKGLMGSAANASLLLLNGDVSYARHAPSQTSILAFPCHCRQGVSV